ncbi:hypothetical protein NPS70_00110 [Streptomyces sp. C10-9-1]|uniref:hypothetical protein n=1 Tax=Streptomyces sp. C10-9-1 TaxID=1859285 RepID=UPI002112F992|nr:hypothetical protein [Streptomyces sp. C10-9-1]MCQ6551611.1 hypothetical protein [Streptomyces sp. C10-9-1]
MSTTRHLINRQRRLASASRGAAPGTAPPAPGAAEAPPSGRRGRRSGPDARGSGTPPAKPPGRAGRGPAALRGGRRLPVLLCLLSAVLGAFAAYGAERAHDLRDRPAVRNTALTDTARTSEAGGAATRAVEAVFSYDFADPEALDRAVAAHLTGAAVEQHAELLAAVREQGPRQRLVLTTTVTDSAVERVEGDRARVLVYADQSSTRTAAEGAAGDTGKAGAGTGGAAPRDATTYAAAMLAADLVRKGGSWRIAALDTLGAGS